MNLVDTFNYQLSVVASGYTSLRRVDVLVEALENVEWEWRGKSLVKYHQSPIEWVSASHSLETGRKERSYKEAAKIIGCTEQYYRARLKRALEKAKVYLREKGELK